MTSGLMSNLQNYLSLEVRDW